MNVGLRRLKVVKRTGEIIIEAQDQQIRITPAESTNVRNDTDYRSKIEEKSTLRTPSWAHFHRNRDGSVAIAIGRAPLVWPENE